LSESSESQRCRVSTVHVRRFQMSLIVFGLTLYIFATTETRYSGKPRSQIC
jgi:hypothetical protein